jgi:hypothetical protein
MSKSLRQLKRSDLTQVESESLLGMSFKKEKTTQAEKATPHID